MTEPGLPPRALAGFLFVAAGIALLSFLLTSGESNRRWWWTAGALIVGVAVALDARSRGMSMAWGLAAITVLGLVIYLVTVRLSRAPE